MRKLIATAIGVSFLVLIAGNITFAAEFGTAAEAEAMVRKAIQLIKTEGKEKAFAAFCDPKGKFVDRDLYITVYDFNGNCLAHGANPRMIGKNFMNVKDPDGVPYMKERVEMAKTKGKGWQNYKFANPLSKKIEPKAMYIERFEDIIVACGIYKK
jgi:cytochrome c